MAETIVRGSRAVAAAAHRAGARLVHLSTDLVFDGEHGAPYAEDAEPRPVGDYGAAKLEAERLVAQAAPGRAARPHVAPLREAGPAGSARAARRRRALHGRDPLPDPGRRARRGPARARRPRARRAAARRRARRRLPLRRSRRLLRSGRGRRPGRRPRRPGAARRGGRETSRSTRRRRPSSSSSAPRRGRGDRPFGLALATIGLPFSPVRRDGPGGPIFFEIDRSACGNEDVRQGKAAAGGDRLARRARSARRRGARRRARESRPLRRLRRPSRTASTTRSACVSPTSCATTCASTRSTSPRPVSSARSASPRTSPRSSAARVSLRTREPLDGRSKFKGEVKDAGADALTLERRREPTGTFRTTRSCGAT